jgi:acyl-CoA synthetase (AMP-forming)/AMP-acid ligase II
MTECLLAGAAFHSTRHFDAHGARETIRRHAVQRLVLVPTMLRRLCEGAPLENVAAITVAGAKLTAGDHALCGSHFPRAALREYYGASELGFITVTAPDDAASSTAVGKAFPGVAISVLDAAGKPLPTGETGTVFVESPLVATGYLGAGDGAGLARFGALATVGDLGFLEADGTLHLLGRAGGMVLSGGNNIYPSEVEAALQSLPLIRAAHVFGRDHADLGSELVAVIEPAAPGLTAAALTTALADLLPRYKQPRRLWLCAKMPTTPSGKVEAKTVRQWVAEESDVLEPLL